MLRAIAISALLTGLVPGVARGAWLRPVPGPTVVAFSYAPDNPYAAGQHRGVVLTAKPGAPVRAACAGRVAFAGSVGRAGPTVSVECGSLRATYQGITNIGIEEGETVHSGDTIAHVGQAGAVHLGARAHRRQYVDPARLFTENNRPLGPAPPARTSIRRPHPRPSARPPAPAVSPSQPPASPPLTWIALAVALAALGPLPLCVAGRRSSRQRLERRGQAQPTVEGP